MLPLLLHLFIATLFLRDHHLSTLDWKEPSAIIVAPTTLCYDVAVYVSHTLLSNETDYKRMKNDIEEILVTARKVYSWHRIELRIIRVVFFNESDPFELTANYDQIMEVFAEYVTNMTDKADAYVLLIDKETTEVDVVGRAFLGTACTNFAIAVIQGGNRIKYNPASIGRTMAHELGHILNMDHAVDGENGCRCALQNDTCIMGYRLFDWTSSSNSPPFHSCSIESALQENYKCLQQCSPIANKFDVCGDGVNSKEESRSACDCGTKETCEVRAATECCDFTKCKLKSHARCSEETCCTNCQFTPGKVCRGQEGECGLSEICPYNSAECPVDLHVYNGKSCGYEAYCFDGNCADKNLVCQNMFKKSLNVRYSSGCDAIMQQYYQSGYCNDTSVEDDKSATKLLCQSGGDPCSYVWCEMDKANDQLYVVLTFNINNEPLQCYTLDGSSENYAPNGYLCDVDKICHKGKCSLLSDHITTCPDCPEGTICSNQGTCAYDG